MKIWHDTSQTPPVTSQQSEHYCTEIPTVSLAVFINTTRAWLWPSEFCQEGGGKGDKLCSVLTLNKRLQSTCCAPTTSLAVWQNGSIQIIFRPSLPIVQNCPPFPEKFMIRHFYQLNNKITGVKTVGVKTTSFFSSNWIRQVAMRCVLWSQICYGQIWFLCSSCCFTFHFFHIISHWCNKQSF